mgnify:CR=1 FL=1
MRQRNNYDFNRPIRIKRMKSNGLDIMFYTMFFSVLAALILIILCMKKGVFGIYFELWRVLLCIPLIILASYPLQLLKELRVYVPLLAKKSEWNIDELMALTGKDRRETERIITRCLESAFIVDSSCEKQVE